MNEKRENVFKNRLYLDNCCFNRPFDDQNNPTVRLETEAKLLVQNEILRQNFELAWSYMMDYEINSNPFKNRKEQIIKWRNIATVDTTETSEIIAMANVIMKKGIKPKDSLHISAAIATKCKFFLTTDKKLLNKNTENITIINPIDFIKLLET